jgi:hypothetical protein
MPSAWIVHSASLASGVISSCFAMISDAFRAALLMSRVSAGGIEIAFLSAVKSLASVVQPIVFRVEERLGFALKSDEAAVPPSGVPFRYQAWRHRTIAHQSISDLFKYVGSFARHAPCAGKRKAHRSNSA